MFKLEAGERDYPAYSWGWIASTVASAQVIPEQESLHSSWVLLIKVLEDYKSLKIVVEKWNRLEKVLVI